MFRGTGIVPVVQLFISKHGMDSYKELVSYLSEDYQHLYEDPNDVLVGKSYPLLSHIEMLEAMNTHFYPEKKPDQWLPEYMLHQMNFGINVFYKIIIKMVNIAGKPSHFATFTMRLWRRYHNTGNYYVLDGSKTDLTMLLSDFEGNDHPIMVDALRNCFVSALSLSKAKNVKCKTRKDKKKNGIEYHLSWDQIDQKSTSTPVEPLLRGTAIVPFIKYFIHKHGADNYDALVSKLSEKYQSIYRDPESITLDKSYPELSHIDMLKVLDEHFYNDKMTEEWVCEYMNEQMNFGINQFYKFVLKLVSITKSPRQFAEWSLQFWYKYHNTGELKFIKGDENNVTFQLMDFIGNSHEHSRVAIMCATKNALTYCGAKKVNATNTYNEKKNIAEFNFNWS